MVFAGPPFLVPNKQLHSLFGESLSTDFLYKHFYNSDTQCFSFDSERCDVLIHTRNIDMFAFLQEAAVILSCCSQKSIKKKNIEAGGWTLCLKTFTSSLLNIVKPWSSRLRVR